MTALLLEPVRAARPIAPDKAPYPRQLVLDWTDYCNAKCFFCWREKYEQEIGGMGGFIPFEKLKKLEAVLSKVEIFGISSGIGEPLLHPELDEILTWLYGINPSIRLQTVTNGTTLTAAKAAWFAGHLEWLSVSLNAANGEAHMRDMFPHLAKRGINPEKRFDLHVRHLTEFLAALPLEDRRRVRFQMVTHRHNVNDVVDFVRLVHRMGGFQAVFTNIAVHPETIDWSLYWIKDQYNDLIEEACDVGARLGVQVHAVRFFTGVKPVFDLDKVCRDPIDIAYISRSSSASPCCHWTEAQIPVDYYNDEGGFEKYWNSDLLQRLREKRDFASCRVCGMSRIFDETSFHFSPKLKQILIKEGRMAEINRDNDFPDAAVVRACVDSRLDLPSIRRTLLALGLPAELSLKIESDGIAALPALELACWEAFQKADVPFLGGELALAGPFLGIGWGVPIHEPQNKLAARWICAAQVASLFARVKPEAAFKIKFTVHHVHPVELEQRFGITVCGRKVEMRVARDAAGHTILNSFVAADLVREQGGRLLIRVGCVDAEAEARPIDGHFSLIKCEISESSQTLWELEGFLDAKDDIIAGHGLRIAELEKQIAALADQLTANPQMVSVISNAIAAGDMGQLQRVIVAKDKRIADQDGQIAQLGRTVTAKDKRIEEQNQEIARLGKAIAAKDQHIAEQNADIVQMTAVITAKDKRIADQNGEIAQAERTIATKDERIAEQNGEIAQTERTIATKDERIVEQNGEIAQLGRTIAAKDETIEELRGRIAQLERQLDLMHDSRSWRLTAPLRGLSGWLYH